MTRRYHVDLSRDEGRQGVRVDVDATDEADAIEQARAWLAENEPASNYPETNVIPAE